MATIKDIAQLAGVSQGTVSNVLNGKGIVSSKKIVLVEEAAKKLGYIINERAKTLRKGKGKVFAVIVPKIDDSQYVNFFEAFKAQAQKYGYDTVEYVSSDIPAVEKKLIGKIKSSMVCAAAVFTCLGNKAQKEYVSQGFSTNEILFVERSGGTNNYVGFDYALAGKEMALHLKHKKAKKIVIICDSCGSHEHAFCTAFYGIFTDNEILECIITAKHSRKIQIINAFEKNLPQVIVCTNIEIARTCYDIKKIFFAELNCTIECLSPLFTLPEYNFHTYELNYHLLGGKAADQLQKSIMVGQSFSNILENTGYRDWSNTIHILNRKPQCLNILLLDAPPAYAVRYFSRIYAKESGIQINTDIVSYDTIHNIFENMQNTEYDIIRMGADVLPWYGPKILKPLDEIDFDLTPLFDSFIDGMADYYSLISGKCYAVPISPSLQILFYRKDLFTSTVLKRLYQEQYHEQLDIPRTFAQYNNVAAFFTKSNNPHSPVEFGSTCTLGNSSVVAGTEFLTRYFSYTDYLFQNEVPLLETPEALQAMKDLLALRGISSPPALWWTDAAKQFAAGNTAMTILFSNFASELWGPDSKITAQVDFAVVPGTNPLFGGGSLGISRYTKYPEHCLSFVSWLCKEPVASGIALFGGNPLSRQSLDNYDILETYPWMELLKTCFSSSHCRRRPENTGISFNDRLFMTILGKAVKSCWFNTEKPENALKNAVRNYLRSISQL